MPIFASSTRGLRTLDSNPREILFFDQADVLTSMSVMYGTKCYVIKVVASMYIGVCIKGMSQCRNTHYEEQEQKCEVQSLCSFF